MSTADYRSSKSDGQALSPQPPEPQALADYAHRIGAERRNFRRYIIKEQQRELYHFDRYIISIATDGEVQVREAHGGKVPDEINPTDEEQEAIKQACSAPDWSTSKAANPYAVDALRNLVGRDAVLFQFREQHNEQLVTFVQQRKFREDGGKVDLPWSYWSDDVWRCMEPDTEKLPLFGLEQLKQHWLMTVFVHEGAKTAWFMQQVDTIKEQWWRAHSGGKGRWIEHCPWSKELKGEFAVAHIGWPGGAPNPHRVDWEPLRRLPPYVNVIVVCDHDPPGENAASTVSYALQRRLQMLRFGGDFPRKFDLSDPFPEELYQINAAGVRVYKRSAPTFQQCLAPATWATTADGRLRAEFVEEWLYSVKPLRYVNRQDVARQYNEDEFNALVAPFCHPHVVSKVPTLLQQNLAAQADTLAYNPGRKSGRINYNGLQAINVYRPSNIVVRAGDAGPWVQFLEYLIPDPGDRKETERWCATLIACAHIRMAYSVLLVSEKTGVGKTTLAEILAYMVGIHNVTFPSAETITKANFNRWAVFKRLVVIAEIYAGHSVKTFNTLKSTITDAHIEANLKYVPEFDIENWVHFFATSNSYNALKIDDHDRRWFVPGVTEQKKPLQYFVELRRWLEEEDGYEIIAHWAQNYVQQQGGQVLAGEHAPSSSTKRQVIEEAYAEGERLILHWGRQLAAREQHTVVPLEEVRSWLASKKAAVDPQQYGSSGKRYLETARKISAILQHVCGLQVPAKQFDAERGIKLRVVANFGVPVAATWGELKELCVAATAFDPM